MSGTEGILGGPRFPYHEVLRSVMVSPVFTCGPGVKVREAVGEMSLRGLSSVVVVEESGLPVGILTERDVIKRIIVADGPDASSRPVSEVMTRNPVTLTPDDTIYRALSVLSSRGIKHLPLIEEGRLAGMVTMRQLLRLRHPEPMMLIEGIARAGDAASLGEIKRQLPRLAVGKLSAGVRPDEVVVMLSLVHQDIHRRAFELVVAGTGEPPVPHCLFLTGSHGRLETLLSTDQDHGIVFADPGGKEQEAADAYFGRVAETYAAWLEEIGFPRCPGGVMAVNPVWRKSLSDWKSQLEHWIIRQVPNLVRYVTVFFDALPVVGRESLFQELSDHAFSLLGEHYEVLRMLHDEEGSHRVPVGLLGRFITERKGEHKGELDIKRSGLIFLVEGVRILALLHGVRETSTVQRVRALVTAGRVSRDDGEYFEAAYRWLVRLALTAELEKADAGRTIDTFIDPATLLRRDKEMLRHSYRAVKLLQDAIALEFGELVL